MLVAPGPLWFTRAVFDRPGAFLHAPYRSRHHGPGRVLPGRTGTCRDADPVVAIVNGTQLHKSDLEAAYEALPEQYRQVPLDAIYDPLLDQIMVGQLVLAAAEKKGLANDPEVQAMIARAKDNVLRDGYVKQAIEQGTTSEKLHAAYDAMKSQPGFAVEETHAAHILVADEAEATAIIKQLQGGADFATLAKEKSTDPLGQDQRRRSRLFQA